MALALGATDSAAGGWLLFALAFGLLGDVMLLSDSVGRFEAGLAAFLVGHLGYLVCFSELGLPRPTWSWAVFAVGTGLGWRTVGRTVGRSRPLPPAGPDLRPR